MRIQAKEKILLYKVVIKSDSEAFGKLYDLYVAKIYRFIFLKVGLKEEAEDLTSEVFLKAWDYLAGQNKTNEAIRSFSGLIYQIARNSIIDYYRRRSRTYEHPLESIEDLPGNGKVIEQIEIRQEVSQTYGLLKKLKQEYQEVVLLKYTEELSFQEISDILGKSKLSVRVTLHRAIKKLKELRDKIT